MRHYGLDSNLWLFFHVFGNFYSSVICIIHCGSKKQNPIYISKKRVENSEMISIIFRTDLLFNV